MSALAPSLWLLGGSPIIPASSIWILLLARSLPSILYVRARLRLEYNENAELMPLIGSISCVCCYGRIGLRQVASRHGFTCDGRTVYLRCP